MSDGIGVQGQVDGAAAVTAAWRAWHASREQSLRGPRGPVALVRTTWLPDGAEPDVGALAGELPAPLTITAIHRDDFDGAVEHGYRVWDPERAARRGFGGVATFGYDPAWVVPARWVPAAPDRQQPFLHRLDGEAARQHAVPGDIVATIGGVEHRLHAFVDGDHLLFVFADATNRSDDPAVRTYPAGRFLLLDVPAGEGEQEIVLDFNRAIVPPCGFSDQFNCPLAPPSNRLPAEVRAGERLPVFASPDAA